MVIEAKTPQKKSRKSNPEHKKYQKWQKPDEDEEDMLEFVAKEEEEQEIEVVVPGGQMSLGILSWEQNRIKENIAKNKLVHKGQLFHLPISSIHWPSVDTETGRRPLEIREPHVVHVDHDQCPTTANFKYKSVDDYTCYVIGRSHSAKARR